MMSTSKRNISQVANGLAPEARRSEEKQGDSRGSTLITDSLVPETERSGPLQDSVAPKAAQFGCC
jgi:hypothetical protein